MHEDKIRGIKSNTPIADDVSITPDLFSAVEQLNKDVIQAEKNQGFIGVTGTGGLGGSNIINLMKASNCFTDEFFNAKIEELPEHDKKYNKDAEAIKLANEKMKNISNIKPETIKKDGKVLRKRTRKDYDRLWLLFKTTQLKDFQETMKYGEGQIKKIGIKKFINTMDWYFDNDVSKWKTDVIHIIPCVHCGLEFTTYENDLGLCPKCKSAYDLERFAQTCTTNEVEQPGISYGLRVAFVYDAEFRNNYRFKSLKEQIREAMKEEFTGINSFLMLKNAIEEERYSNLYTILNKHKDKMTSKSIRVVATINAAVSPYNTKEEMRAALTKLYFEEAK
jgi:hypothetical protein